jgi:hypothetical protein
MFQAEVVVLLVMEKYRMRTELHILHNLFQARIAHILVDVAVVIVKHPAKHVVREIVNKGMV